MTERINYKLAHNGSTHKFASTMRDDQLFDAVRQKVGSVACADNFELFWQDDESSIVLDTVADLSTAIDFARAMREKTTDTPCVHLTATINSATEATEETKLKSEEAVNDDSGTLEAAVAAAEEESVQEEEQAAESVNTEAPVAETVPDEETDKPTESTVVAARAAETEQEETKQSSCVSDEGATTITPADVLPEVQKHLRHLFDSALADKWLTDLRTAMAPLYHPLDESLQSPSETCAAEIAACLGILEKKIPDELKGLLERLTNKQLREFVHGDWLECDASERFPLSAPLNRSSHNEAAYAVQLALEMAVFCPEIDFDDYSEDEKEDESSDDELDDEKATEVEQPSTHPEWIRQRSSAIYALARKHMDSVQSRKNYLSPTIVLQRAKTDPTTPSTPAPEEPSETTSASVPVDRLERLRENLRKLPELPIDPSWEEAVADSQRISSIDLLQREDIRDIRVMQTKDRIKAGIADLLARTLEEIPLELEKELESLSPEELGRMVVLDWTDRMNEEKRAVRNLQSRNLPMNEMETYCSFDTLHDLMLIAIAVQMYPEEIRKAAKHIIKKHAELMKKTSADEESKMSDAELKYRRQFNARDDLMKELGKYMEYFKSYAFLTRMVPPVPRDYTLEYLKWKDLASALEMTQEMHQYTNEPYLPEVQNEIAAMLYRYERNSSERALKRQEQTPRFLATWSAWDCLRRLEETKMREGERNSRNNTIVPLTNIPSSMLAALMFMNAAYSFSPDELGKQLAELSIQKSRELVRSEEARALRVLRASCRTNPETEPIPPAKTRLDVLIAWVDKQSAAILRKGQDRLKPVFRLLQPTPPIVEPQAPYSSYPAATNQIVQPVQPQAVPIDNQPNMSTNMQTAPPHVPVAPHPQQNPYSSLMASHNQQRLAYNQFLQKQQPFYPQHSFVPQQPQPNTNAQMQSTVQHTQPAYTQIPSVSPPAHLRQQPPQYANLASYAQPRAYAQSPCMQSYPMPPQHPNAAVSMAQVHPPAFLQPRMHPPLYVPQLPQYANYSPIPTPEEYPKTYPGALQMQPTYTYNPPPYANYPSAMGQMQPQYVQPQPLLRSPMQSMQPVQKVQPVTTVAPSQVAPAPAAMQSRPKENQPAATTFELSELKAKLEELERFVKGKIASFQTKMNNFEEKLANNNCEKENREFNGLKKQLVEMEKRLKIVEEDLESDLAIL